MKGLQGTHKALTHKALRAVRRALAAPPGGRDRAMHPGGGGASRSAGRQQPSVTHIPPCLQQPSVRKGRVRAGSSGKMPDDRTRRPDAGRQTLTHSGLDGSRRFAPYRRPSIAKVGAALVGIERIVWPLRHRK
eukprot:scaffold25336_cov62-Phaeocystis_antarctica.AAC.2